MDWSNMHSLKTVEGRRVNADVCFFFTDLDDTEYLAYYEGKNRAVSAARIEKSRSGWLLDPIDGSHPVMDYILALEERGLNSDDRCMGESYRLTERDGCLGYVRRGSGRKMHRFVRSRRGGQWLQLTALLMAAAAILFFGNKLGGFLAEFFADSEPVLTMEERREALPTEEEYLQTLWAVLDDQIWPDLSEEKKAETLQLICDWETTNILGCSACTVRVDDLDESTLGHYNKAGEEIVVSRQALRHAGWTQMLEVITHETRHAWQRDMIGLLIDLEEEGGEESYLYPFGEVRQYRDVWVNYTSGQKDYDAYYEQSVESDAREWSALRLGEYYLPMITG